MRISLYVYRSLIVCLILLGFAFIGGTIYGVFFLTDSDVNEQVEVLETGDGDSQGQIFTGIGRIRVQTADPQPGVVIVFLSFMFDPNDRAFSEELVLKVREFRDTIADYIGSFSTAELHIQDEEKIKTELLRRFNAILRLGQIETLFFIDFMIL